MCPEHHLQWLVLLSLSSSASHSQQLFHNATAIVHNRRLQAAAGSCCGLQAAGSCCYSVTQPVGGGGGVQMDARLENSMVCCQWWRFVEPPLPLLRPRASRRALEKSTQIDKSCIVLGKYTQNL